MALIEWTAELDTGISVIDGQHRRIVDYINQLDSAEQTQDHDAIAQVMHNLVDYTESHFAFEEALMEEAGYPALTIHQGTHQAFCDKLHHLNQRFVQGEAVARELIEMLRHWLIHHIQHDDSSYVARVKEMMPRIQDQEEGNWLRQALRRFFK